jgi:hypothetical protein
MMENQGLGIHGARPCLKRRPFSGRVCVDFVHRVLCVCYLLPHVGPTKIHPGPAAEHVARHWHGLCVCCPGSDGKRRYGHVGVCCARSRWTGHLQPCSGTAAGARRRRPKTRLGAAVPVLLCCRSQRRESRSHRRRLGIPGIFWPARSSGLRSHRPTSIRRTILPYGRRSTRSSSILRLTP